MSVCLCTVYEVSVCLKACVCVCSVFMMRARVVAAARTSVDNQLIEIPTFEAIRTVRKLL